MTKIELSYTPYHVALKHTFAIAGNSRQSTPVMIVQLSFDGIVGYGEASMPPYLGEDHQTAEAFLSKINLSQFSSPFQREDILDYIDTLAPGNHAAKASIDIALHDLVGKLLNQPWHKIWGYSLDKIPSTSFTIGIDSPELVRKKTTEANGFKLLKVKVGGGHDKQMLNTIREVTSTPICVDANQGWTDKVQALETIHWMQSVGVVFVEQPMPTTQLDDIAWLTAHSPLPIIADESVQRLADIPKIKHAYSGINIKLMKCTGMREAHQMVQYAKVEGLKVMLGCMTATSCPISAMSQLSPLADWADLDGNLLITNDPYKGSTLTEGRVMPTPLPGIGVSLKDQS